MDGWHLDIDEVTALLFEASLEAYATSHEDISTSLRGQIMATITSGLTEGQQTPRSIFATYSNQEDIETTKDILELFLATPLKGHRGNRMTPVMVALTDFALEQGRRDTLRAPIERDTFRAPIEQVRLRAGLGARTVRRAIEDLIEDGWLEKVTPGSGWTPATYRLTYPPRESGPESGSASPAQRFDRSRSSVFTNNGHDAFDRSALGAMGQRILALLETHPDQWWTQVAVAQATGASISSINRHLKPEGPLIAHQLIERSERGHVRLTHTPSPERLQEVASATQTLGTGDRRRRRLAEQYQEQGHLTADLHWIDPSTHGPTTREAAWLQPTTTAADTETDATSQTTKGSSP